MADTLSAITKDSIGLGSQKQKEEEIQRKLVKVIDLLQHSAELGHTDALFTLAQVSLVRAVLCAIK
jgi:SEL1 protein